MSLHTTCKFAEPLIRLSSLEASKGNSFHPSILFLRVRSAGDDAGKIKRGIQAYFDSFVHPSDSHLCVAQFSSLETA